MLLTFPGKSECSVTKMQKKTYDSKYRTACSQIPMDPMPRRCSNMDSMPGVMKMSKGNPERSTQPAAMSHAAKMSARPERYLLGESIPKGQGGRYPISDKLGEARSRLYRSRFFFLQDLVGIYLAAF